MPGEVVSSRAVTVRLVSALLILLFLLWIFSTFLFLPLRIFDGVYLGDIIVAITALLYVAKSEELASPLASELSLRLRLGAQKVGGAVKWILRLLALLVLYIGLYGVVLRLLTPYFEGNVSSKIYDVVFVAAAASIVYETIKALTS